jgi:uncharacterized membrane protein YeaQ/YmgE (transglycosylase-associated protein family)
MGILSWIAMGLLVGVVAKLIMPGKDPGGFIITILIGIAGAFVGGFIGTQLGIGSFTGWNWKKFLFSSRWRDYNSCSLSLYKKKLI